MIHTHRGSATGSTTNGGKRPVAMPARSAERARNQRKTRVPRPTQTPALAPSRAHFNVLISSAVCSVYQRLSSARVGTSSESSDMRLRRAYHSRRASAGDANLPDSGMQAPAQQRAKGDAIRVADARRDLVDAGGRRLVQMDRPFDAPAS